MKTLVILMMSLVLPLFSGLQRGTPRYNPETETTIKGTVTEVKTVTERNRWGGIHLLVNTGSEMASLHLGPASYLTKQGYSFTKGDRVEAIGSRIKDNESEALIVRELKIGSRTLTLRNAQGFPLWAGGRFR
ncbi:MAG: DNA-binding protein [Acidobacteriota bacterium]